MFFDKTALTGTAQVSDVVVNGAGGDAANPLWLAVKVHTAVSSAATVALKTSDSENMSSSTTLVTLDIATTTKNLSVKIPKGAKKYLRLDVAAGTSLTTGNVTAGLVLDV